MIGCQPPPPPRRYEPFVLDLGLGRKLIFDGHGLSVSGASSVPDGTYGLMVFQDGVPIGVLPQPLPVYTPPPCVPPPEPCGDGGSGSGGDLALDPSAANLSRWNLLGQLLTAVNVVGGDRVHVTGSGAQGDPLRISVSLPASRLALASGSPGMLTLSGEGTDDSPYLMGHAKPASFTGGPGYGGFAFDSYGHAVGYEAPPASGVNQVTAAPGTVEVLSGTGVVVLTLSELHHSGLEIETGWGTVTVDQFGRVSEFAPAVPAPRSWRVVTSLASSTEAQITFDTDVPGQVRGSVLGLGLADSASVAAATGWSATLDGVSVNCWSVHRRLEMKTIASIDPGAHVLILSAPSNVATPVIVDLDLCL
jgi:hypothetical protein